MAVSTFVSLLFAWHAASLHAGRPGFSAAARERRGESRIGGRAFASMPCQRFRSRAHRSRAVHWLPGAAGGLRRGSRSPRLRLFTASAGGHARPAAAGSASCADRRRRFMAPSSHRAIWRSNLLSNVSTFRPDAPDHGKRDRRASLPSISRSGRRDF